VEEYLSEGEWMMRYEREQSPLIWGILYSEASSSTAETLWYESKDERDEAIATLLECGEIPAGTLFSTRVRAIKPHSFSAINADEHYYKLINNAKV
jgi:hypothetical protein